MLSNKSFFPFSRILSSYSKSCFFYSQASGTSKPNYYNILGISQTATQAEIKSAYLKKAKEHHPDVQRSDSKNSKNAEEIFKQVVEAYGILSDDIKRRDYDNSIKPASSTSSNQESNYYSSQRTSNRNTQGYTYEKFYGKPSSPQYDEEMFKEFHKQNIKQRKEESGSFLARNIELIVLTGLAGVIWLRWFSFYSDLTSYRKEAFKSEKEKLNPEEAEDEGIYVDMNFQKPKDKKLSYQDCHQLDIEQLDELDRMGYHLPSDFKEKVMEFREAYRVYKAPKKTSQPFMTPGAEIISERKEAPRTTQSLGTLQTNVDQKRPNTMTTTPPPPRKEREQTIQQDQPNENNQPKDEKNQSSNVRVPRMHANLYTVEKNK